MAIPLLLQFSPEAAAKGVFYRTPRTAASVYVSGENSNNYSRSDMVYVVAYVTQKNLLI